MSFQGDFKTLKQLKVKCTWFPLPSPALWIIHPVMFRWNSLTCSLTHFWQSTLSQSHYWIFTLLKEENFPHLRRHAQKILVLFGSTYVCEQTFSVMKFNKSRYRSSITDDHLSAVLRISTSDIQPDFNALVEAQARLDFSH